MKGLFYPKFAFDSITKNKNLYIPYILTSILWIMMFYIITALSQSGYVAGLKGGSSITMILSMGSFVIMFFALLFLFYTNSFLSKRRNKEYALYNILGMNKKNISCILLWDSIITFCISIFIGLILGTLFFKVAELALVNIIKGEISYNLSINWETIIFTIIGFGVIFALVLIKSLFKIQITKPIELLRSEAAGEKPPKSNWFVGILGIISLGIAYYIAITTQNPFSALSYFFMAVLLVIIGTFLLFISGSVLFCRILQKNKSYYYKANHFISISSMMHRMKRNGAGLAAICILATMVLVMLSSTASLYFGMEDALKERYPKEINIRFDVDTVNNIDDDFIKDIDTFIKDECEKLDVVPNNTVTYQMIETAGELIDNALELDSQNATGSFENICQVYMISLADYNRIMEKTETLKEDEILLYTLRREYLEDTLKINKGNTFKVAKKLDKFWSEGTSAMSMVPSIFMVVKDLNYATKEISELMNFQGNPMLSPSLSYSFDSNLSSEQQIELCNALSYSSETILKSNTDIISVYIESRANDRADFYGLYGGLFFIGIILSILFISAAVLIIYYKQIVEGYEDKNRFEIMQKVGMTKKEIRKSINSQLLTVFFMPLIGAGIHMCFAFPIVQKLLLMFNLNNILLFAITTIIIFLIFGLFYALIYRLTSNSYYNIVSRKEID